MAPGFGRCDNLLARKADITAELVSRLVWTQFPQWAGLPVRRVDADGWDNATFRLGEDMSVRLPSAEKYVPAVQKEQHWLPILAEQLPLPVPEPLAVGVPGCGFPWPPPSPRASSTRSWPTTWPTPEDGTLTGPPGARVGSWTPGPTS